jgi:hypothetical protein
MGGRRCSLHIEISPALFVTATIIIITAFSLQSWFIAKIARGNSGQENFDKAVQAMGAAAQTGVALAGAADRIQRSLIRTNDMLLGLAKEGKEGPALERLAQQVIAYSNLGAGNQGGFEPPHFRASPAPGQSPEADHDDDVEIDPRDL